VLTEAYLRREYQEQGRSSTALAVESGCTHKTVLRYLGVFGIPVRGRGRRPPAYPHLRSGSFLRSRRVENGATVAEIAAEVGCSRSAVARALRAHGIVPRGGPPPGKQLTVAFLTKWYVVEGRSTVEIAEHVGCGPTTVARHLRRCGIALRARGGVR
jgi:AraC-like DNA-binding protein